MWHRILALTIKEFLALLKDKRGRTVLIIPPLVQLIVFGYGATYDLNDVRYAVFNEDPGYASRQFLAELEGSPTFHLVSRLERDAQIAPTMDRKQVLMVVRIGPVFTQNLMRGQPAQLQVIVDGRDSNTALVAVGYMRNILMRFNEGWKRDQGETAFPARLHIRAWFNPNLVSRWFVIPGIVGLLTQVVTTLVTALSVAREREAGTFDQLLVTPLRPVEILLGKTLPGLAIGIAEASVIILLAVIWFHVPLRGSLLALYLGLFLFILSIVGVGLMISSLALTQQQGLLGAFMFIVPSIILSGFATPISNMPPFIQHLTLFIPLRYFLIILRSVFLEGANISILWPQFWPMALIGLINLSLAGLLFRRRLY